MGNEPDSSALAPLGREEYIEQAHFFARSPNDSKRMCRPKRC